MLDNIYLLLGLVECPTVIFLGGEKRRIIDQYFFGERKACMWSRKGCTLPWKDEDICRVEIALESS